MRLKQVVAIVMCAGIVGTSLMAYTSIPHVEAMSVEGTSLPDWEPIPEEKKTEEISEPDQPDEEESEDAIQLADDNYMLAKLAMAEARGEDVTGKALVIRVVLNRVDSEKFPDTVEDVIYQHSGRYYQFSVIPNGSFDSVEPDEDCWEALNMVRNGWDESQGATFFDQKTTRSTWHNTHLETLFSYGGHTFYKEFS